LTPRYAGEVRHAKAQLVITSVVLEGRSKSVARDYDVSRQWIQQVIRRYHAEGRRRSNHARVAPQSRAARAELDEAKAIAKRAAVQAHDNGTFETAFAKSLGVDRMTVRRWLGKRD
jgi:transposase-like protein